MQNHPHILALTLFIMQHPISAPPSILQDGKLKPGIYKIQNVYTETFLDLELNARTVCARPAHNLEEGRGLVRPFV